MGIALSLILLVVGLILAFAVEISSTVIGGMTIDWIVVGYILTLVGIVGLVWELTLTAMDSDNKEHIKVIETDASEETAAPHRRPFMRRDR